MMRFFRFPEIIRFLFPDAVFKVGMAHEKVVCLTFDDGPDPATTPVILSILRKSGVRAIFFCSGQAAEKYPEHCREIIAEGHQLGNHGYRHIKGRQSETNEYIENAEAAAKLIGSRLFRPPFGSLTLRQYKLLKKRFKVFMWDLMVYDFDQKFGSIRSLNALKRLVRPGSVIVMHDKTGSSAPEILNDAIEFLKHEGYSFTIYQGSHN